MIKPADGMLSGHYEAKINHKLTRSDQLGVDMKINLSVQNLTMCINIDY